MKILAMFLPQFHTIPENDEWWGKGFTEWTNIKKENKYCDGLKPLDNNYYNLLDKKTVQWQTDLCAKYGIYGMCYYHYYFNGKMLLEKPAENLLKWKDINQKFCFMWANHTWYRSWQGKKDVLIEQTYGDEKDWKEHFEYLLQFFEDERYIKIDNKPLFSMFNYNCPCINEMMKCFDTWCKEAGFDGIYFIQSVSNPDHMQFVPETADAVLIRQPDYTLNLYNKGKNLLEKIIARGKSFVNRALHWKCLTKRYNGNMLMKKAMKFISEYKGEKQYFWGAYSMWDNTYRHEWRGYKITRPSKQVFEDYLTALKNDSKNRNAEYVFFNAWNEWAEGMTLEPTDKYGYYFLESIKQVSDEN